MHVRLRYRFTDNEEPLEGASELELLEIIAYRYGYILRDGYGPFAFVCDLSRRIELVSGVTLAVDDLDADSSPAEVAHRLITQLHERGFIFVASGAVADAVAATSTRGGPLVAAWTIRGADGPIVTTAIHDGHDLRPEVAQAMGLRDADRRREEDPFTGVWTAVNDPSIVVHRSRFEVDLNRPRATAVYQTPKDAWGLQVWRVPPAPEVIQRSLCLYDTFYESMQNLFDRLTEQNERVVVLDLHAYNHRRDGPDAPAADPRANPEVNIGTGSLDRDRWAPVIGSLISDLRRHQFDVRENVKFRGGHFSQWLNARYPTRVCAVAVEFKKCFMDEWTGALDTAASERIEEALSSALPGLRAHVE